jgi:hypothetical protein
MLAPGGWVLFFLHHGERAREELEAELIGAAALPLRVLWRGESGLDFPERDPRKQLRLTAFVR